MIDISGFVWGEVDFRALLPLECPWTISSGTQRAESPTIQDIAVEVPLDDLQRHSKGRKPHNSRYCRRSALGLPPAALKGQKAPQFKILPSKCPWTASSGTQAAQERQLPVRGGEREKYGDNKGNSSKKEYKKIFTGSGGQGIDRRNTRGRHVGALRCQPAALVLCGSDL